MRLLFFTNVFPNPVQPTRGVFNLDLARALAREHEVRVVSPVSWVDEWRGGPGSLGPERRERVDGIEVHYPRFYYPPKVLRTYYGRFLWVSTRGLLRSVLAAAPPDAVLGYWAHPDGEVAVRVARGLGVPSVVMVGGSDVLVLSRDPARARAVRRVLMSADAVVALSRDLEANVLKLGVPRESVHRLERGVDPEKFSPGDRSEARRRLGLDGDDPLIVWVGRMVPVKGLDVLVDAAAQLQARGLPFRLALVGDGPLRASLEATCRDRGLSGRVRFVGPCAHDGLADWYRAADVTALPSRSEGIPNVLRESLACGTPFVASRVGGVAEIAGDPANRLVPPGDPSALADALAWVVRHRPRVVQGRSDTPDDTAGRLTRLVRSLVPTPAGPCPPPPAPDFAGSGRA